MNVGFIHGDEFSNGLNDIFGRVEQVQDLCIFAKWDLLKQEVRSFAIEQSSVKSFRRKWEHRGLLQTLNTLHELECAKPDAYIDEIDAVKVLLQHHDAVRYRGASIRSRSTRFLSGEQPTRRSLDDERRYALSKQIVEVADDRGRYNRTNDIVSAFHRHYTGLFGMSTPTADIDAVDNIINLMPVLGADERSLVDGPLLLCEIEHAIDTLKCGKTPGPDGIGAEFYKTYKDRLAPLLLRVFQNAFATHCLPPSFYKSHTALIPKSSDDDALRRLDGYRPISPCNVDYKIFSKVLTERLQSVVTYLVGEHQTCGIRGRCIQTNIHVARSVIECVSESADQVALVQIDLSKAFHRVCHSFLFKLLRRRKLGDILFEGIQLCYRSC